MPKAYWVCVYREVKDAALGDGAEREIRLIEGL